MVTGGGSGIGAAIARAMAAEGAAVIVAARGLERCRTVVDDIVGAGGNAISVGMDHCDPEAVSQGFAAAKTHFGNVDVLVNNAGPVDLVSSGADGPAHEVSEDAWDRIIRGSLYGPFNCCRHAIPQMIAAGRGSIINISSIAAVTGLPVQSAYSAGKGGLSALTRSIAFDYGRHNIRANTIVTGFVVHEGSSWVVDTPEKEAAYQSRHLTTRLGRPEDIAMTAVFLASEEAGYITGSDIPVEGGSLIKSRPDTPRGNKQ